MTEELHPHDEMVLLPGAVFGFLVGETPLEGCWFGEENPTRKGAFWWRSVLRETVQASPPPPTEGAEIVKKLLLMADQGDMGRDPDPSDVRRVAAAELTRLHRRVAELEEVAGGVAILQVQP